MNTAPKQQGFTLIELSIVLVIIGLIVGGVLVGQDLIRAAAVRATITQIEKYNTAANTFRGKYGYLPGDIKDPDASSFGFQARGAYAGEGDGNGIMQGNGGGPGQGGGVDFDGENLAFWVDLSTANLIDGTFTDMVAYHWLNNVTFTTTPSLNAYLPAAKLGNGNYVYVYSNNSTNYFGIYGVQVIGSNTPWSMDGVLALTVQQAYSIDKKVDDGFPQSGSVTASFANADQFHAGVTWVDGNGTNTVDTGATAGSPSTCFDNGNVAGIQNYSLAQNNGNGVNCALSFQFQ